MPRRLRDSKSRRQPTLKEFNALCLADCDEDRLLRVFGSLKAAHEAWERFRDAGTAGSMDGETRPGAFWRWEPGVPEHLRQPPQRRGAIQGRSEEEARAHHMAEIGEEMTFNEARRAWLRENYRGA